MCACVCIPPMLCLYVYPHRFDVYANLSPLKAFPRLRLLFFVVACGDVDAQEGQEKRGKPCVEQTQI